MNTSKIVKIAVIFLLITLSLAVFAGSGMAAGTGTETDPWYCGYSESGAETDALTAVLENGTLTIQVNGTQSDTRMYNWFPFLSAKPAPWTDFSDEITTVVLGDGISSIGDYAFFECENLTAVSIPASVTTIGDAVFTGCVGLQSFVVPETVTTIGFGVFSNCSCLTSVTLPSKLTTISKSMFSSCISLPSLTIPDSVTSIEDWAFYGCSGLTSITIPARVSSIGSNAFFSCTSLESIVIPEGVTSLSPDTFYGCSGLISVSLPETLTSIGDSAFMYCSNLESLELPEKLTSLGANAFQYSGLKSIVIPSGVTAVENETFCGCASLASVSLPETVTSIGDMAFYYCPSLKSVMIPAGITGNVGSNAFSYIGENSILYSPDATVTGYLQDSYDSDETAVAERDSVKPDTYRFILGEYLPRVLLDRENAPQISGCEVISWHDADGTLTAVAENGDVLTYTARKTGGVTYYVDAVNGSDDNTGITVKTALKTVNAAIGKVADGDTVKLLTNIELNAGIDTGKNREFTLDLNGKVVTAKATPENPFSVLYIGDDTILTLVDSNPSAEHYFDGTVTPWVYKGETSGDTLEVVYGGVLTGGLGAEGEEITEGGGVYNVGTLIMYGGNIVGNSASSSGGVDNQGVFLMNSGSIAGNSADFGGGLINWKTFSLSGDADIHDNAAGNGGGVFNMIDQYLLMSGGSIQNNKSEEVGGGVTNRGTMKMSGGTISGNSAVESGGGIYNHGHDTVYDSTLEMTGGTISDNTAVYGGGVCTTGKFTVSGSAVINLNHGSYGGGVYNKKSEGYSGITTMDGGSIDNNTANAGAGVYNNGVFILNDGDITDNTAFASGTENGAYGGGICNWSEFTMNGGYITYNKAISEDYEADGGGVCNAANSENKGIFVMNAGMITDNTVNGHVNESWGGGVCTYSEFTMNGGEIIGNSAEGDFENVHGGGVHYNVSMKISGTVTISGNTAKGETDNLYLSGENTVTVSGDLKDSVIGVTTGKEVTAGTPVPVTGVNTADYSASFVSDHGYLVMNEDYTVKLGIEQKSVDDNNEVILDDRDRVSKLSFASVEPGTTVTYIDGLQESEKPEESEKYDVLGGFKIEVSDGYHQGDKVWITFKAISLDPEHVRLMHQLSNGKWEILPTTWKGGYEYVAVTTSFCSFAVIEIKEEENPSRTTSSVTSFFGTRSGDDFTFDRAVVITKATLPGATSATVTNTSGNGWYTCNLTADGFNGRGAVYFQVPLDVLAVKGYTVHDVSLAGSTTTYRGTEGQYATYSAEITCAGQLTIDFAEDAAKDLVIEKPQYEDTPKTQDPVKTGEAPVTTENPVATETPVKSPFPVMGILAGIGAAGVLVMRRK